MQQRLFYFNIKLLPCFSTEPYVTSTWSDTLLNLHNSKVYNKGFRWALTFDEKYHFCDLWKKGYLVSKENVLLHKWDNETLKHGIKSVDIVKFPPWRDTDQNSCWPFKHYPFSRANTRNVSFISNFKWKFVPYQLICWDLNWHDIRKMLEQPVHTSQLPYIKLIAFIPLMIM